MLVFLAAPAWAQWAYDPLGADPPEPTDYWGVGFITAADGDGDGDLDVLAEYLIDLHVFRNVDGAVFDIPTESDVSNLVDDSDARVEVADLDLDGDDDSVFHGDTNTLMLCNGDLTYTYYYPILSGEAFAVGDLDGDGKPDIVASDEGRVVWHPNTDGTFGALGGVVDTFELIADQGDGAQNVDVAAGDLDGDGDADVLSSFFDVQIVENLGGGVFAPPVVALGDAVDNVQLADLDGDGDLDVLSKSTFTLAWSENLGGLAFGPLQILATPGLFAQAVAADVDGDADLDIAFTNTSLDTVSLYENLGGGVFAAAVVLVTLPEIEAISAADVDGDGTEDLLALQGEDGGGPLRIEPDSDGDGLGDLAELHRHHTDPTLWDTDGGGAPDGLELRLTLSDLFDPVDDDNDVDGLTNLEEIAYGGLDIDDPDTDHDGLLDGTELEFAADPLVADTDGGGTLDGQEYLNETDPNQLDDDWPATIVVDETTWPNLPLNARLFPYTVALGDLTGDGALDLLVGSTEGLLWLEHQGVDSFVQRGMLTRNITWDVTTADLEPDGDLDVVIGTGSSVGWGENDGAGGFTFHELGGAGGFGVAVGDVDGDGDLDVLSANNTTLDEISLYKSAGGGVFDPRSTLATAQQTRHLALFDLEQDLDLDVIGVGDEYEVVPGYCYLGPCGDDVNASGEMRWYENDATGTFVVGQDLGFYDNNNPGAEVEAADLDADGWTDIVVCMHNQLGWFRNLNGVLTPWARVGGDPQFGCHALAVGDREGDGLPEVFFGGLGTEVHKLHLSYITNGTTILPIQADNGWAVIERPDTYVTPVEDIALGDIDGDGDLDVVAAVPGLEEVRWHRNVLDVDGDGIADELDLCLGDNLTGDADLDGVCVLGIDGVVLDCDDADPTVYTGAPELCDGLDNSCTGAVPSDEADDDLDSWRTCNGDCDDADLTVYTGAPELCDGVDNACAGVIPAVELDTDADGFRSCDGDCDDGLTSIHPGAAETCGDGIDDDCDGADLACPEPEVPDDEPDVAADGGGCSCDATHTGLPGVVPFALAVALLLAARRRTTREVEGPLSPGIRARHRPVSCAARRARPPRAQARLP